MLFETFFANLLYNYDEHFFYEVGKISFFVTFPINFWKIWKNLSSMANNPKMLYLILSYKIAAFCICIFKHIFLFYDAAI